MTLQDLKNNREAIIATITEKIGAEYVKPVMEQMVKGLSMTEDLDWLIEQAIYMATEYEVTVEKSRLAQMMAKAHDGERYNTMTKEWEKI